MSREGFSRLVALHEVLAREIHLFIACRTQLLRKRVVFVMIRQVPQTTHVGYTCRVCPWDAYGEKDHRDQICSVVVSRNHDATGGVDVHGRVVEAGCAGVGV